MNKLYTIAAFIGMAFVLLSNDSNPPDGHTGAPGEVFCANCHSSNGTLNTGTITVQGFPVVITPLDTYDITIINKNTNGGALEAGFQLTILGPTNTKAGEMSSPSDSSQISNFSGRQYWEHHPSVPYRDSVATWTIRWVAPNLTAGSVITWYANGIIGNGNNKETGDKTASGKGTGSIQLAGTKDISPIALNVYPNPGTDFIRFESPNLFLDNSSVLFFDLSGKLVEENKILNGVVTPHLPSGLYLIEIQHDQQIFMTRWSKI